MAKFGVNLGESKQCVFEIKEYNCEGENVECDWLRIRQTLFKMINDAGVRIGEGFCLCNCAIIEGQHLIEFKKENDFSDCFKASFKINQTYLVFVVSDKSDQEVSQVLHQYQYPML